MFGGNLVHVAVILLAGGFLDSTPGEFRSGIIVLLINNCAKHHARKHSIVVNNIKYNI